MAKRLALPASMVLALTTVASVNEVSALQGGWKFWKSDKNAKKYDNYNKNYNRSSSYNYHNSTAGYTNGHRTASVRGASNCETPRPKLQPTIELEKLEKLNWIVGISLFTCCGCVFSGLADKLCGGCAGRFQAKFCPYGCFNKCCNCVGVKNDGCCSTKTESPWVKRKVRTKARIAAKLVKAYNAVKKTTTIVDDKGNKTQIDENLGSKEEAFEAHFERLAELKQQHDAEKVKQGKFPQTFYNAEKTPITFYRRARDWDKAKTNTGSGGRLVEGLKQDYKALPRELQERADHERKYSFLSNESVGPQVSDERVYKDPKPQFNARSKVYGFDQDSAEPYYSAQQYIVAEALRFEIVRCTAAHKENEEAYRRALEKVMESSKHKTSEYLRKINKALNTDDIKNVFQIVEQEQGQEEVEFNFIWTATLNAVWEKFSNNKELRKALLNTNERVLVFASPDGEDPLGVGIAKGPYAESIGDVRNWPDNATENMLGQALMVVRAKLRLRDSKDTVQEVFPTDLPRNISFQ